MFPLQCFSPNVTLPFFSGSNEEPLINRFQRSAQTVINHRFYEQNRLFKSNTLRPETSVKYLN